MGGPAKAGPSLLRCHYFSMITKAIHTSTTAIGHKPKLPSAAIKPVTAITRADSRSEPFLKVSIDTSVRVFAGLLESWGQKFRPVALSCSQVNGCYDPTVL